MIENKIILTVFSLIMGITLKTLMDKILNKTKVIYYTTNSERVAISNNDPIFGNIKVEWEGYDVNNLYNTVIKIENTTSTDFENIEIKIWSGKDTLILNEKTALENTTQIIPWSENYKTELFVKKGESASEQQINKYRHERIYNISIFNRGQKLQFTYLSSLINNDSLHGIWVELIHPGLKLKQRFATNRIHGVLVSDALVWGLLASFITVILSSLYLESNWQIATISMTVGLIAQSIGAYIYKSISLLKNLISN